MTFWTFAFLALVFGWIGIGRLVNSDAPSGRLARDFIAGLIARLTGPNPK